ncbi:MAG: 16S rRNA (adenine(1518)-N(6)/adenine(1519)-N(6))-dimethyltransferase RsmA [Lachnospiraceae bacterium]|nr:16S rRNA (adenine(1518)-N(6)/adenine(1519)-N(6))-dimethyltransferase RsmA [Lachnospiraceae bacterium]
MASLGVPRNTIEILKKYNIKFQKKFGQNFLIDTHVLDKIINAAGITENDFVLEIGPGIGTMTQYLCENAREVMAVEIDKKLIPVLSETLSEYNNVTVVNKDILKMDINKIAEERNGGRAIKVAANLPYYITTPVIMGILESHVPLENITVMVQKEVAQRMQAGPGTKDYGALSLAVQYYSDAEIIANVPANCFMPRPNVDSAVIKLCCHSKPCVNVNDEKFMFKIIRASFNQRRKTLQNGIANDGSIQAGKEQAAEALRQMGLSETIRGEVLSLKQFAEFSNILGDILKR